MLSQKSEPSPVGDRRKDPASIPKPQRFGFRTGYHTTSDLIHRWTTFLTALILTALALPLMLAVAAAVWVFSGRPILYRGERLGQDKKPFMMYKFRTLVPDASERIGPRMLGHNPELMTPIGKFLRDTRLDELPQLFNVLKGDMDLVGPRPERPIIYERICSHIPDYDKRFEVKPGVIGYSQLFTPHSAPKRIRTLIDNKYAARRQRLFWNMYGVAITAIGVARQILSRSTQAISLVLQRRRRARNQRAMERIAPSRGRVFYRDSPTDDFHGRASLIDINEQAFLMRAEESIPEPLPKFFKLETVRSYRNGHVKRKSAHCFGSPEKRERQDGLHDYVVFYTPISPVNYYMMHQYFLDRSFL